MLEKFPSKDIETVLRQALFSSIESLPAYPGYPETRLTSSNIDVARQIDNGFITHLPEGPWDAGYDKLKQPLSIEDRLALDLDGYRFDAYGRPLHPWLTYMLLNPNVGVVTGTGAYWQMGPNRTADPIIIANEDQPYVFLVKRVDNGLWALPGGFIDPGEDAATAGRREAFEEGGVVIGDPVTTIYSGVVADTRTTAYAWAETTALLYRAPGRSTPKIDPAEVSDARWFPLDQVPDALHGSHSVLLEEAIQYEVSGT